VKLSDVGAHALSNLARHKLRTALTLAGVGVGVATLTVMVSLGAGLQRIVKDQFDKAELVTRITVAPEGAISMRLRGIQPVGGPKKKPLDDAAIAELEKVPGVIAVWPENLSLLLGDCPELAQAFPTQTEGLPTAAISPQNHVGALLGGRYWNKNEEEGNVVVAPSNLARELGLAKPEELVGKKLGFTRLQNLRSYRIERPAPATSTDGAPTTEEGRGPRGPLGAFELERGPGVKHHRPANIEVVEVEVLGVYDSKQFGLSGDRFHCPPALAKRLQKESGMAAMMGGQSRDGTYRTLTVKVADRTDVEQAAKAIQALGFDTLTVDDILKGITAFFVVIELLLSFFGGIGLVVSFFGIANTMVMAVLERTREIGVLKALGARDRDVRRVFIAEAASIGLVGGTLGVVTGWFVGFCLNALATWLLKEQLGREVAVFYVPAWLAIAGISVSGLVATVAGLYPAIRASRLDPVVSLRAE
jgi:putative ABC transport system permease protein